MRGLVNPRIRWIVGRALLYLAVLIILLIVLLPFIWILLSSLKSESEIMRGNTLVPSVLTLTNYAELVREHSTSKNFTLNLLNSMVVSLGGVLSTVSISTLAAYSLSRYHARGTQMVSRSLILIYVFPTIIIVVPLFRLLSAIGLSDSFVGLILVEGAFALPFCIWLLNSFFASVPISLEEAAMIDGAGNFKAFYTATLPIAAPGLATAAIYTFIISWGDYLFSSIFIVSDQRKTLPLGLATYMADQYIEWGKLVAGAVIVTVPVLVMFYPLSRYFIRGFIAGALKE